MIPVDSSRSKHFKPKLSSKEVERFVGQQKKSYPDEREEKKGMDTYSVIPYTGLFVYLFNGGVCCTVVAVLYKWKVNKVDIRSGIEFIVGDLWKFCDGSVV